MRNIFIACSLLCALGKPLLAQTPQYTCRMIEDPEAARRKLIKKPGAGSSAQSANACGNYYVNVFFHFIRDNSGATGQSVGNIGQYMNILNNAFNGQNVFFTYKGYDEIRNSTLASASYNFGANFNSYNTTNQRADAINIYLFRADNTNPSGIATRISNRCAVGGGDSYAANYTLSGVLAHEVGHCLSLLHTHHGTDPFDPGPPSCPEDPSGSNGTTCGDFIADTPADPNIGGLNGGNCASYSRTVSGITYNPNPQNYMCYATPNCLSFFSAGQGTQFRSALDFQTDLQPVQQIAIEIVGPGNLCSATGFSLLGVPPGASISWSTSSNIQLVSGQGSTSVSLQPASSGPGTINVSVSLCGTTYTSSRSISVGPPAVGYIAVNGQPTSNASICVNNFASVDVLPFDPYSSYTWSLSNPGNAYITNYGSANTAFNAYVADCYGLTVQVSNACGTTQAGVTICAQNCFARYTVSPNPSSDRITVQFDNVDEADALPDEVSLLSEASTRPIKSVNVRESFRQRSARAGHQLQIDVSDLPRGIYYLHIKNSRRKDKEVDAIRILLE